MKRLELTGQFRRDLKRIGKRRYDIARLDRVLELLRQNVPLPSSCRPHQLKGRWKGFLECHVAPDWLLIYQLHDDCVLLVRTGTHSDLFDE